jgi:hypothetical protein
LQPDLQFRRVRKRILENKNTKTKKIIKTMIYTPELIKSIAPAVFATSPSSKMTNKYEFVPTHEVMEMFDREGWQLSSVKQTGRGIHNVHELKYRNGQLPKVGDTVVEAIIRNSHDGSATFSMGAGLFRLVCSNGLTVPTSVAERFSLRHNHFSLDEVKGLAEDFSKKLPKIEASVSRMMEKEMTEKEKLRLIKKAVEIRWALGSAPSALDINDLLTPFRPEDEGSDLWTVFNVIQEKMMRGGFSYQTPRGRTTKLRGIKSIQASHRLNTKLWEAAEELVLV